jgi:hypothetical protein
MRPPPPRPVPDPSRDMLPDRAWCACTAETGVVLPVPGGLLPRRDGDTRAPPADWVVGDLGGEVPSPP